MKTTLKKDDDLENEEKLMNKDGIWFRTTS